MQQERVQQFAGQLLNIYTGGVLTELIDIGYQTGLFKTTAAGPGTSQELSQRAGLHERYVREWLGAMTTSGIVTYDPNSRTYTLPAEHAALLTGHTSRNLAPLSKMVNLLGNHRDQLVDCFRHGGGVSYDLFRPEFTDIMDDTWRRIYDEQLISGFIEAVEGLPARLHRGIQVADIGCGTGHTINLMAQAYPNATFVGYDLAEDAIAKATAEAATMGVANARFEVRDVATLPAEPSFDLITAFDSIHDQVDPAMVLRRAYEALAPHGMFLMIDFKFSSNVEENMGNPFAPLYYGISTMHCLTVSLADGGTGLGTVWGLETARQMLTEAGFTHIEVVDSPRPQNCLYVCRP
jgi:ubiquinone/menaquinone biosynthesis C-methylase UbiE